MTHMDRSQWEAVRALQARDAAMVRRVTGTLQEVSRVVESLAQLDVRAGQEVQRHAAAELNESLERVLKTLATTIHEVFQEKEDNLEDFDSSINAWALQTLQRDVERLLLDLAPEGPTPGSEL